MNKNEASIIINNYLEKSVLNPNNNGNVKFANKSNTKNVYWINIHLDQRLTHEYHIILNDKDKNEFTHLVIPPNELKASLFKTRYDKTNGLYKIDIELSYDSDNYLKDIKSGGTYYGFRKYVSKIYHY